MHTNVDFEPIDNTRRPTLWLIAVPAAPRVRCERQTPSILHRCLSRVHAFKEQAPSALFSCSLPKILASTNREGASQHQYAT